MLSRKPEGGPAGKLARALLLSASACLTACSATPAASLGEASAVHHVVLCWLKHPDNTRDRDRLIGASRSLAAIPEVEVLHVGPVLPSERRIVDDSFDVGLYFRFASPAAMERYLSHPDHVRLVKEVIAPLTSAIRVYDFTAPAP